MCGGSGVTDAFDIGFFPQRARVAQQFLGDASFDRDRYVSLNNFQAHILPLVLAVEEFVMSHELRNFYELRREVNDLNAGADCFNFGRSCSCYC
jgi:hypothetical protein